MRPFRLPVLFVLLALLVSGTWLAAVSQAATGRTVTLRLVEKSVGFHFVDTPPLNGDNGPPSIGDHFGVTSELRTKAGQHAGWLDATCTVSRGGNRPHAVCYGAFLLKGGQIAGITDIDLYGNAPVRIAVVGGTGVYEGVSGSVLSASRGENSPFSDDTFHLIWH